MRTTLRIQAIEERTDETANYTQLKNFDITVDGQKYNSGDSAVIEIKDLSYGLKKIELSKSGYASVARDTNLDLDPFFGVLGENQVIEDARLLSVEVEATGISVSFMAKDWLSGLPLNSGQFVFGDKSVTPKDGVVKLVVPPTEAKIIQLQAKFGGAYIDKTIDVDIANQFIQIQTFTFTPAGKHYFVSKRTGVFTVYSSNVDGSELQEVVNGTQQETNSLAFVMSPSGKFAVMASSRDGTRDAKGRVLQKLYIVNVDTRKLEVVDSANSFQFHDWSGDKLAYSGVTLGEGAEQSTKLKSVDGIKKAIYDLGPASTNTITNVHVARDEVIYIRDESCVVFPTCDQNSVNVVGINGGNFKELAKGKVKDMTSLEPTRFVYKANDKWFETNIATDQTKEISEPNTSTQRTYISTLSPGAGQLMMVDFIDGKNTLIVKSATTEKQLHAAAGLGGPMRWLSSDVITFRVANPTETADYAISLNGGLPQKISDVTATIKPQGVAVGAFTFY